MALNSSHAAIGVTAVTAPDMVSNVLQQVFHQAPAAAQSEAGLIVLALGALYGAGSAWLASRKGAVTAGPPAAPSA